MNLRTIFLCFLGGLLVNCASPGPWDRMGDLSSNETFAQFQDRVKSESDGISSSFSTIEESRYYANCIGKKNLDFQMEFRGKCYYSNCYRVRNAEKCEEVNLEIKRQIDQSQANAETLKQQEQDRDRKAKYAKCFSGDLQTCVDWIHFEDRDEYDVLGKMCDKKKIFQCKTNYEKPNVEDFKIKCKIENAKVMTCEEIYKEQFASTKVIFLN